MLLALFSFLTFLSFLQTRRGESRGGGTASAQRVMLTAVLLEREAAGRMQGWILPPALQHGACCRHTAFHPRGLCWKTAPSTPASLASLLFVFLFPLLCARRTLPDIPVSDGEQSAAGGRSPPTGRCSEQREGISWMYLPPPLAFVPEIAGLSLLSVR